MRRSDKAAEILRSLEKQPNIPASHIEYAQRSMNEWAQRKPEPAAVALPESVDELLACGYLRRRASEEGGQAGPLLRHDR